MRAGGRRLFIVALLGVLLTPLLGGCARHITSSSAPARLVSITIPAPPGAVDSKWLSYPGPPRANVLLPAGYNPHRRYPLVIFLNGLGFNYSSYAEYGLTEPFEDLGAIVVMPEGGNGWYADWWNDGRRGQPSWESYHLDTVIPAISARFPILPQRRFHALIGISMGGLGATYLGGRRPGFFGSVASLSGFVDPQWNAEATQPAMAVFSNAAANGISSPTPIYGPPLGFYASGHNPTLLARNLVHTRVFVSTGTGIPSPSDPHPDAFATAEEHIIFPMSESYHDALVAAGVDVEYQVHPGVHGIPDFLDEIHAMLAWGLFAPVPEAPPAWENHTVATSGRLWDVGYRFSEPPDQVVTFGRTGTTLSISDAGSDVTISTGNGCVIHTSTPAALDLPDRRPDFPRDWHRPFRDAPRCHPRWGPGPTRR
jgi:S-formylglutathione hydrolase FrmB